MLRVRPHTSAISAPPATPAPPIAVFDVDHDEERAAGVGMEVNGFSFEGMDAPGMDYALNRCAGAGQGRAAAA